MREVTAADLSQKQPVLHTQPMTPIHGLREIEAAFRSSAIFKDAPKAFIDELIRNKTKKSLNVGQYLFFQGDVSDALYCVIEGEVEISLKSKGGKEVHLALVGAGSLIGEFGLFDGAARSADAIAVRRSVLVSFPRSAIIQVLRNSPDACLGVINMLVSRLRTADEQIRQFAIASVESRLAQFLLANSDYGRKAIGLNQAEIARRLGARRETINRKLSDWRRQGFVTISQVGVKVISTQGLLSAIIEDEER